MHVGLVSAIVGIVFACVSSHPFPTVAVACLSTASALSSALLVAQFYTLFSDTWKVRSGHAHLCLGLCMVCSVSTSTSVPEVEDKRVILCAITSFLGFLFATVFHFVMLLFSTHGLSQTQTQDGSRRGSVTTRNPFYLPVESSAGPRAEVEIPAYFENASEDPLCDKNGQQEPPKYMYTAAHSENNVLSESTKCPASVCDRNANNASLDPPKNPAPDGDSNVPAPPRYSVCNQIPQPAQAPEVCARDGDIPTGSSPPPDYTELDI
ncbi:hypothetical protein EGW08_008796 [Elysia chlorotica]|uniref:MARVEL domain-containing protein n=1 Tax=Elysia chlorotica TaxID=188477 RepID=A0A433TPC3_ELYCH|nr:hypothetical protein EGW08_008796 [Elysia chlorotica]